MLLKIQLGQCLDASGILDDAADGRFARDHGSQRDKTTRNHPTANLGEVRARKRFVKLYRTHTAKACNRLVQIFLFIPCLLREFYHTPGFKATVHISLGTFCMSLEQLEIINSKHHSAVLHLFKGIHSE